MIKTKSNAIFRQQAIDHLNLSEENDATCNIISPSNWLWLLVILLMFSALLIWGIFGKIALFTEAPGIIFDVKELNIIEAEINQYIQSKNDDLTELHMLYSAKLALYKKHYLTRLDLFKAKQDYQTAKEDLFENKQNLNIATDKPTFFKNSDFIVLAFIDQLHGKQIHSGMNSTISTTFYSAQHNLTAKIINITQYPISKQLAYRYLHNMNLVDTYFKQGAPFLAKVQLDSQPFPPGTEITAKINYLSCTPLQLLIKSGCE